MLNKWEERPFQLACGGLKLSEITTNLSFSIGGVTKQGFEHIRHGISNQDAVNLRIGDDFIVAVLCDGCTSHEETFITDYSANEVGSRVLSELIANFCYEDLKPRKNRMKISPFLRRLDHEIQQRLKRMMRILWVKKNQQLPFLFNMMTTTVMVAVIRKKDYFVFHCGDGFIGINDEKYNLDSDAGTYLTNAFDPNFPSGSPLLKLVAHGDTSDLDRLYMASDGFKHSSILDSSFFKRVYEQSEIGDSGFIDLISEFHLDIIEPYFQALEHNSRWPIDDASLVMLRKTQKTT